MFRKDKVVSARLLGIRAFREDLRALFSLSSEQLERISRIADSEAGFGYAEQMRQMDPKLLTPDNIAGPLRAASYLYDRTQELGLSPNDAISELEALLPALDLTTLEGNKKALEELLRLKPGYEKTSRVKERAVTVVPHYSSIQGTCDIRPIFDRDSEHVIERIPVVLLTLFWHDDSGNSSQATVQLLAEDWDDFRRSIEKLDKELRNICRELGGSSALD